MILSPTPVGAAAAALLLLSALALLGYATAWIAARSDGQVWAARLGMALLLLGWLGHLAALAVDVAGLGLQSSGARFGFAPALSMTIWLVLTVYLVESRFVPLPSARRVLLGLAMVAVLLAWLFPGESRPLAGSPWAPLHWLLGLASYGLFGVAVLHAVLMNRAEQRMRAKTGLAGLAGETAGMPLLRLERLTFQFVAAGVLVLSLALLLGWWFTPAWRWDHKNLLAVLGWLVLSGLLTGRRLYGWRGRRATRWLYAGAALLLLSYVGTRFVLEVLLQRAAHG